MALWDDIIEPYKLVAEARQAAADFDAGAGSLARYLPNVEVPDIHVEVVQGESGLIEEAEFRAFDAEPEPAGQSGGGGFSIKLPALGQKRFISEYATLRTRNAGDGELEKMLTNNAKAVGRAIAARMERQRGITISTGKNTITGRRFNSEDDFGRAASHSVTAAALWADPAVSRLDDLLAWVDTYVETNDGLEPGRILVSSKVFRALAAGSEFSTKLLNGAERAANADEVNALISAAGLPPIEVYNGKAGGRRFIADERLLLLPEPGVTSSDSPTALGASFWGRTVTSMSADYGIADEEQPGIVVGAHRAETVPHNAWIDSDAIGAPVLANANLTFAAKVL